jgi:hypothetical protein
MYRNRMDNECVVVGKFTDTKTSKKADIVLECKITKGVTVPVGLVFRISEAQFKKDWRQI